DAGEANVEGLTRVRNGTYAFIADYPVLDYIQRRECDLRLLNEHLFRQVNSFALQKNSPLMPSFNFFLMKLRDGGVLEKLRSKWWRSSSCEGAQPAFTKLGLEEVSSCFMLLCLGMLLAVLLCFCECCKLRRRLVLHSQQASDEAFAPPASLSMRPE
ncbi:Ionotropic receptor 201, partial [Hyalella azteca]